MRTNANSSGTVVLIHNKDGRAFNKGRQAVWMKPGPTIMKTSPSQLPSLSLPSAHARALARSPYRDTAPLVVARSEQPSAEV